MAFNAKKLLPWLVTAAPGLIIVGSGIAKLMGVREVRAAVAKAGMSPYLTVLGLMELAFVALFLYSKTMKMGVLLLTAYFAGAIAADISHAASPLPAAVILALVWVAAFVRDRTVFLPAGPVTEQG